MTEFKRNFQTTLILICGIISDKCLTKHLLIFKSFMNCYLISYFFLISLKGHEAGFMKKINMHFKFFNVNGWWSVQNQKEWAHPHISSLPWTGYVLHNVLLVSLTALDSDTGRKQAPWTQTSVGVVMDSTTTRKWATTTQSPLKSHTNKKKTKVLSAAWCESKWNYDQSRACNRINIGYAFDSQQMLTWLIS